MLVVVLFYWCSTALNLGGVIVHRAYVHCTLVWSGLDEFAVSYVPTSALAPFAAAVIIGICMKQSYVDYYAINRQAQHISRCIMQHTHLVMC